MGAITDEGKCKRDMTGPQGQLYYLCRGGDMAGEGECGEDMTGEGSVGEDMTGVGRT